MTTFTELLDTLNALSSVMKSKDRGGATINTMEFTDIGNLMKMGAIIEGGEVVFDKATTLENLKTARDLFRDFGDFVHPQVKLSKENEARQLIEVRKEARILTMICNEIDRLALDRKPVITFGHQEHLQGRQSEGMEAGEAAQKARKPTPGF